VLEASDDKLVAHVDIVTLNHDTLLERSFEAAAIPIEDGFGRSRPGFRASRERPASVRFWRRFRRMKRGHVRLIKLHGSLDWWRLRPLDSDWSEEVVAQVDVYPQDLSDSKGTEWEAPGGRPIILVGTFNKILDYTQPFHLQHYAVMRRALMKCDALVISGYSFRDKAVNGMVTDWYFGKSSRRLMVISPEVRVDAPPGTARGAIANKWRDWARGGRMTLIADRFSDTDWSSIKGHLLTEDRH
jgi:hypothetical protein